jgi:hypothetical protein
MAADHFKSVGVELTAVSSHLSDVPMSNTAKDINSSVIELTTHSEGLPPKSKLSEFVNTAYDVALCTAPILLIMKVGLVFYAHHLDKYATGASANAISDAPSSYTTYLMRFNSQVRSISYER